MDMFFCIQLKKIFGIFYLTKIVFMIEKQLNYDSFRIDD